MKHAIFRFFLRSKITSRGPLRPPEWLWTPSWTLRSHFGPLWKNRFFWFFSIFQDFLAGRVGLQNSGFWPVDPPKVDQTCPTQHFRTSWVTLEYLRSLVDHRRAGFRPLSPDFLKSPEHHLRWHFGGHATTSRSILEIVPHVNLVFY